ncbi:hypothetical protein Y1Q_0003100 [Alligator mississippiensis]|uniref:Uncharacterized protein n=1 Tax=Alligator mississippiensis TaxID=8496 RepID=A0A151MDF6_ALLMI|nr:hypothetical protein Y1Q_0003100 [Alligator mississippiensis]
MGLPRCLLVLRGAARGQLENKSKGKPRKQICQVVLDHFEKQYTKELGDAWIRIRLENKNKLFCFFNF